MAIHKGLPTKDGRCYYFTKYKCGINHTSPKYLTRKECEDAQSLFVLKNENSINKRFDLVANDFFNALSKTKQQSTVYTYIKDYNKHIKPFFNKSYINKLSVESIRIWAAKLNNKGYSIEYLNKLYHLLKSIFDYAIKNYGLKENPATIYGRFQEKNDKIVLDQQKIRYITLEEFNKFISVVDDMLWKTFFITLFYSGARKGELVALTWKDIDFENNEIIINKTLYDNIKGGYTITSTKNSINRKIKMSKTLKDALYKY